MLDPHWAVSKYEENPHINGKRRIDHRLMIINRQVDIQYYISLFKTLQIPEQLQSEPLANVQNRATSTS